MRRDEALALLRRQVTQGKPTSSRIRSASSRLIRWLPPQVFPSHPVRVTIP